MGINALNINAYSTNFKFPFWLVGMVVGIAAIGILSIFLIYTKYFG